MFQYKIGRWPTCQEDISMGYIAYPDKILFAATGGTGTLQNAINQAQTTKLPLFIAPDNYSTEILDNFIHDNDNNSIVVMRSAISFDGTIVRGNQVAQSSADFGVQAGQVAGSGWYGNGLCALNASDILVTENVFLNSTFSGVRLDSCFNAQVTNNQIYNSGETALMWECPVPPPAATPGDQSPYRFEGGVIGNNVVVNAGVGISVTNGWYGGRRVTISGNQVKTITRNTITTNDPSYPSYQTVATGIVAENDCVVTGNIVEDCASGPGIVIYSGGFANGSTRKSADLAVGNTVKGSQIGIGFFMGSSLGFSMLSSNIVEGYTGGAIVPVTLPGPSYNTFTRVAGSTDYGTTAGGLYTGKPFSNVMIGLNFAI
ncbi:MAG: right-handed parallel beta-helix repeat-containing protein [Rhodoblastus sp.]